MRAMILAAGRGSRLGSLTDITPKPLIKVAGRALIEYQIEAIRKAGINEIVINTGWLGQQLIEFLGNGSRYKLDIEYSVEPSQGLETGGGIYQALPLLGDKPFFILNADIFHQINLKKIRADYQDLEQDTLVHLILTQNPSENLQGDFALLNNGQEAAGGLVERTEAMQTYTYSGMGIYHPKLFSESKAGIYSVVPLIKKAIQLKKATGYYSDSVWFDVGTQERLSRINEFILGSQE